MYCDYPREIDSENFWFFLEKLEKLYRKDWPKHLVIRSSLQMFIHRFKKMPELMQRMKLFILSDNWENDGQFFVAYTCTEFETFVFFDALNENHEKLKKVLLNLDYTNLIDFFAIRNEFRSMTHDTVRHLNLNMIEDTRTDCYCLAKEDALQLAFELPPNTTLKSLDETHVNKINSRWPHRYENSEKFVSYSIKYLSSIGLFSEHNELMAWCLHYDNGLLALLQVDDKHKRKGYGSLVTKAFSRRIAEEYGLDVGATVVHENVASKTMFEKIGFKIVGPHTWFVLKDKRA